MQMPSKTELNQERLKRIAALVGKVNMTCDERKDVITRIRLVLMDDMLRITLRSPTFKERVQRAIRAFRSD